jgi:hypothetical protein
MDRDDRRPYGRSQVSGIGVVTNAHRAQREHASEEPGIRRRQREDFSVPEDRIQRHARRPETLPQTPREPKKVLARPRR